MQGKVRLDRQKFLKSLMRFEHCSKVYLPNLVLKVKILLICVYVKLFRRCLNTLPLAINDRSSAPRRSSASLATL